MGRPLCFFRKVLFTNMTRSNEIGANSYLLDFGDDGSVVLDAGMHPKFDGYAGTPDFSPLEGKKLNHRGRNIFYTGDINFADQTLMKGASFPASGVDVLITECTRGGTARKPGGSRPEVMERLVTAIEEVFEKGGAVMIPIFAMGKTQELLSEVYLQWQKGRIGKRPLFIGGLSKSFSTIYDKLAHRYPRSHPNLRLLNEGLPEIMDGRRIRNFKPRKGDLYLISSGMMSEKTLSNTLGQKFVSDERHAIFFVGYCDPDSPAGRLLATPKGDYTVLDSIVGEQQVKCRVEPFDLTAHAQREDILDYILKVDPKICMLVHGDQPALEWFQATLAELRPNMKVIVPPAGKTIEV